MSFDEFVSSNWFERPWPFIVQSTPKRECVFPMVIWPDFRMGQYRVNDHPYHAPHFTSSKYHLWENIPISNRRHSYYSPPQTINNRIFLWWLEILFVLPWSLQENKTCAKSGCHYCMKCTLKQYHSFWHNYSLTKYPFPFENFIILRIANQAAGSKQLDFIIKEFDYDINNGLLVVDGNVENTSKSSINQQQNRSSGLH